MMPSENEELRQEQEEEETPRSHNKTVKIP